ncbi:efflux RND transporter periplasmic adaptor subunit [Collimonas sp.]|jgi:membrane fusion protein (multidrug efflux system)|uniref:efflux RND transporter periplasmic adaptor subunit n=1 Tax=Collimonas sp. TaxID=1963772 RepID=UPI002C226CCE|nr:efflux RND transporter periplasmic adaptor subunit [Collimonas sp.]HWX02260.1 efflux RND transporter periplasmic adaptor subunit [Collimonas sp.]
MHTARTNRYSAALAAALAILTLAACSPKRPAAAQVAAPEVGVVTARRTSVPVTMELPGRTSAYLIAQVRARVDGIVQKRSFQEGADVKADQPLYQIDPAPYQAALNSARATQQKAEANLAATSSQAERYKILIGGNAVSKQAYDNAVAAQGQAAADVAAAKAAVATAGINLGYTKVVAPIGGRSSISQVTQGAYVQGSAATLLTTVQQIDPIYVDLNQSSVAGLQLRRDVASGQLTPNGAGQVKVMLTLEDGSQYPLSGTLQFNGVTVDPSTGSVTLRALFPNPKYVLLPGMFVRARIEQGVNDKAILVPIPGVSHNPQGQATALVVGPGNKVVQRTIQTQNTFDNQWVVTGGLDEGERIIVSGAQKVQPGMLVRASETPGQSSLPLDKLAANSASGAPQAAMPASTNVAAK